MQDLDEQHSGQQKRLRYLLTDTSQYAVINTVGNADDTRSKVRRGNKYATDFVCRVGRGRQLIELEALQQATTTQNTTPCNAHTGSV